jgi:hypothetical protein
MLLNQLAAAAGSYHCRTVSAAIGNWATHDGMAIPLSRDCAIHAKGDLMGRKRQRHEHDSDEAR